MRSAPLAATVATALLVSACAGTGTLSPLQPAQSQAQADMASCRTAARSPGALTACSAKYGPALASLAQQRFDEAGRAQDRATRINHFAAAANAGWDSGTDAGLRIADTAIEAGGAECGRIGAGELRPARDCALLSVGPGFVAHVRTTALVDRIEAKPRGAASAAEKRQLNDASLRYVRNTFDFVESRRQQFDADPSLDASLRTMLDRQRAVFFCTALHISAVNRRLGQADTARRVSRDRDRILAADPSLQGETCASVA